MNLQKRFPPTNATLRSSYDGQHKRAVACLKYAWEFFDREGDGETVARSSLQIGQVSWMQVRAEYHQAASDDAGSNDGAPQYADTLAEAEVWLRKALDLAWENYICNFIADAQHLCNNLTHRRLLRALTPRRARLLCLPFLAQTCLEPPALLPPAHVPLDDAARSTANCRASPAALTAHP